MSVKEMENVATGKQAAHQGSLRYGLLTIDIE